MSAFNDMNKNDDKPWDECANRDTEDKLNYIRETIHAKIYENDQVKAGKITRMFLKLGIAWLLPLVENRALLDKIIDEAYLVLSEAEEYKMSEEDEYVNEKVFQGIFYNYESEKWCEVAKGALEEYYAEVYAECLAQNLMETVLNNEYGDWVLGKKEEEEKE